jgi:outer membrane protein assembly factor BamB
MSALRLGAAALVVAAGSGCLRNIPLAGDPNISAEARLATRQAIYSVDWYTPLVKTGLLEYQPSEPAMPAVDPETERIIVTTRDGMVSELSPADGTVEWTLKTGNRFFSGAAIADGLAYIPGGDGKLYALRVLTGEKVWEYNSGEELVTEPTIVKGKALVASQSEALFAVDLKTGKWLWQYRRDPPSGFTVRGASRPAVYEDMVLMGFADGYIVALGLDDGVLRWERKLSGSGTAFLDVDTTPVVDDKGRVFAASYKDGVSALDVRTGDLLWTTARPGVTSLLMHGRVLFASGDGSLSAIDAEQGRALWTTDLSEKSSKGKGNNSGRPPTFARGYIVVPTSTALMFVEPSGGRVRAAWNPGRGVTATPGRLSSVHHGSRLYVLTNLGTVFALQLVGSGG